MGDRSVHGMRRAARALAREARHALKHRGGRLPVPARSAIEARLREIDAALGEDTVGERLESAAEALAPTWYAVSAYAGDRLVGIERIIGDGVL